jgi:hypothetical protein
VWKLIGLQIAVFVFVAFGFYFWLCSKFVIFKWKFSGKLCIRSKNVVMVEVDDFSLF